MFCEILVIFLSSILLISGQPADVEESICADQEDGVLFPIDNFCSYYYYCQEGYGYLSDCAEYGDFLFDTEINECNNADQVDCVDYVDYPDPETEEPLTDEPPSQTTPSNPNQLPDVECPSNKPGELIFFESLNCTEYYICSNGNKFTMKCTDGFVFNKDDNQCDHPVYNPRCSNVAFDANRNVKCTRHGFYTAGYPLDCTKYVYCAEGIPMVQTCPIGTAWHVDRCVAKQYAQCQDAARLRY